MFEADAEQALDKIKNRRNRAMKCCKSNFLQTILLSDCKQAIDDSVYADSLKKGDGTRMLNRCIC